MSDEERKHKKRGMEDAEEIKETKKFIRKAIKQIQEVEGSFTLVEVDEEDEKVKISIE